MRPDYEAELFALAARRTEWAALALSAAADELVRAGEHGALVAQLPDHLQAEAGRLRGFLGTIEQARQQAAGSTPRRVRHQL
jgi:hypothetical protein